MKTATQPKLAPPITALEFERDTLRRERDEAVALLRRAMRYGIALESCEDAEAFLSRLDASGKDGK